MENQKKFDKNIISTLLLIFVLGICFLVTSLLVDHIATESCYKTLDDATSKLASEVKNQMNSNQEQLEIIAGILSEYEDISSSDARKLICSFQQRGMISTLGMLLPGNGMILCNGEYIEISSLLDYNTEHSKTPHLSEVLSHSSQSGKKFIYQSVPILKDGNTVGILYGFIPLDTFADFYSVTAFNGSAEIYIIDSSNGDYILDTWHDTLGNIAQEDTDSREVKSGYDLNAFQNDISSGTPGNLAFFSKTADDFFYAHYRPVGINQWMVMLTVPERIAFADAQRIRNILYLLAAAEIISFLTYFLWVLHRVRKQTAHKERQLAQTLYMLDVQQTLFDAHKNPSLITCALEKASQILTASTTFLVPLDGNLIGELYTWPLKSKELGSSYSGKNIHQFLPEIAAKLVAGESILYYESDLMLLNETDRSSLNQISITNLMLVPVLDSENHLTGVLGGVNMAHKWKDSSLLECIARNFLMALNNLNSYRMIEEMGSMDTLTGLKNRNSYQRALMEYSCMKNSSLCCIYMDANGLHELNNHLGHAAGDEMLRFIGVTLKTTFGQSDSYRIGGDEFVVFCQNRSASEVQNKISSFQELLQAQNYQISIGIAWQDTSPHMDLLISEAERRMYEAKHLYYQEKGDVSKAREMNQKLEQILLEKKDADTFLSIISSYFMGVYVVNLCTYGTRAIYKPRYFQEILEKNDYKFNNAMELYISTYVHNDDQAGFFKFLKYDVLEKHLQAGINPEHKYRKVDGTPLVLRIYQSSDYSSSRKETFWLFEKLNR